MQQTHAFTHLGCFNKLPHAGLIIAAKQFLTTQTGSRRARYGGPVSWCTQYVPMEERTRKCAVVSLYKGTIPPNHPLTSRRPPACLEPSRSWLCLQYLSLENIFRIQRAGVCFLFCVLVGQHLISPPSFLLSTPFRTPS